MNFEAKFQSTLFEIKYSDLNPNRSRRVFFNSYEDAKNGDTSHGWVAVFEDDRLVELEFHKG